MCLRPIILTNPRRKLSLYGGIPYKIAASCGSCAECSKAISSEWYFRAYYESKYTFDNGGYVLFDTLTYANPHLPRVSAICPELKDSIADVPCFNREHLRLFFVSLRRQLEYHGFDVKHCLKYFVTSEYGTDDRYTHRPHYHLLLYVSDPKGLDPLILSRYISKCWKYGRTDGIEYKSTKYVLDHVFGPGYNCDQVHMQSVCNYVAKYVTKDSTFQKTIDSRINIIKQRRFGDEALSQKDIDLFKKLKREMNQFHRQSNGFGEAFIMYNDMDKVFESGMISMPDKNNIVKHIPLPMYYQRKLFYELRKDFAGHLYWDVNELGVKFKLNRKLKSIELMTCKFEDWLINMKKYKVIVPVDWSREQKLEWYKNNVDRFESLLGDRSVKDFVIYLLLYKGRIKSPEEIAREQNGIFKVDPIDEFVMREFAPEQIFGYKQVYNYAHYVYKRRFGGRIVTDKDLGDNFEWSTEGMPPVVAKWTLWKEFCEDYNGFVPSLRKSYSWSTRRYRFGSVSTDDEFSNRYVINDKADPKFENFDKMYSIWCDSLQYTNDTKQKYHDWKEDYNKRMKAIGYYTKTI